MVACRQHKAVKTYKRLSSLTCLCIRKISPVLHFKPIRFIFMNYSV